jgi:acyl-CoA reductase-like NAD-dependent aldehyde dehydrogenase
MIYSINPATEEQIQTFTAHTPAEVEQALAHVAAFAASSG